MTFLRNRPILAIFLLALSFRIILFWFIFSNADHNLIEAIKGVDGYYRLSENLLAGNGFSFDAEPPYRPNPLRPHVYPFFVASLVYIFQSYWAVLIAQLLIGSLLAILSYLLAVRFVNQKTAQWVGVAMALEPVTAFLSTNIFTETVFTAFFLLSLLLFLRFIDKPSWRFLVWSAVSFSLALLVKPVLQFLVIPIPVIIFFAVRSKNLKVSQAIRFSLVFAAIILALAAPWLYRNYKEFGKVTLGAQAAYNLYVYLQPSVLSIVNGTTFEVELDKLKLEGLDLADITPATAARYSREALSVIVNHPKAIVKSGLITGVTFFTHDGLLTVMEYMGISPSSRLSGPAIVLLATDPAGFARETYAIATSPMAIILIARLFWILVTVLFFIGMFLYIKHNGWSLSLTVVMFLVLYLAATTAVNGFGVTGRFRVPINFALFTFAFYALTVILHRFKRNA